MKFISFALRSSRGIVWLAILAGIVSGLSHTGLLAIINTALTSSSKPAGSILLWQFVALGVLMFISRIVSGILLIQLSQSAIYRLRMHFSRQILSTGLRRLEEIGTPKLLAVLTEDVSALAGALTTIPTICMHVAIVCGCLVYLGWLSWRALLCLIPFIVLGIVTYNSTMKYAMKSLTLARQGYDSLLKHFRALSDGIKELKLHQHRSEAFLSEVLEPTAAALRQDNTRGSNIFTAAQSWGQLSSYVLIAVVIFALPSLMNIGPGLLTGYALIILYMLTPLETILAALPAFGRANVAVRRIEDLGLSLVGDTTNSNTAVAATSGLTLNTLEFSNVTHVYYREREDNNFVLGPIDLTIHAGELIFLVGGNGSGKTTLGKLLTGLYVPESGEIRLNSQLITNLNRNQYRQYFSAVFSDCYLFEKLLGLDNPKLDTQAREYLVQLQLDAKVNVKDGNLSTLDLSQGQRKRLALLAAYLEDRPVCLFDEWAADQDPQFKEIFYLHLLPELKSRGKTIVVISHDDRFYRLADRIVRLDYGRLYADAPSLSSPPASITEVAR